MPRGLSLGAKRRLYFACVRRIVRIVFLQRNLGLEKIEKNGGMFAGWNNHLEKKEEST